MWVHLSQCASRNADRFPSRAQTFPETKTLCAASMALAGFIPARLWNVSAHAICSHMLAKRKSITLLLSVKLIRREVFRYVCCIDDSDVQVLEAKIR